MAHLFSNHHETLKKSEREGGKALEKVADREVAEILENSRTEPWRKFNGAAFLIIFLLLHKLKFKMNACF